MRALPQGEEKEVWWLKDKARAVRWSSLEEEEAYQDHWQFQVH